MDDQTIPAALERHWAASDANQFNEAHEIYRDDAVLDYPQSGERISVVAAIFRKAGLFNPTRSALRSVVLLGAVSCGSPSSY